MQNEYEQPEWEYKNIKNSSINRTSADVEPDDAKELAEAHVSWYMELYDEQTTRWLELVQMTVEFCSENMRRIAIDNFAHGYKHGTEEHRDHNNMRGCPCSNPAANSDSADD